MRNYVFPVLVDVSDQNFVLKDLCISYKAGFFNYHKLVWACEDKELAKKKKKIRLIN